MRWRLVAGGGFLLTCVFLGYEYGTLPEAAALDKENPKTTALIQQRAEEAREAGHKARRYQLWVPLTRIAKPAVDAVLISEDARFFQHDGVDLHETKIALEEAWEKKELGRGASTITQQLAKNLWLSGDRSVVRKLKEFILAKRLEDQLTKKRILALYLNVVEWGDGIYGIEAGARAWFGVSAADLNPAQAAILASMLPAPRRWTPDRKSPTLRKRALRVIERLEQAGRISSGDAWVARAEIASRLGSEPAGAGETEEEVVSPE
jgi:monofunctional biosynthetic peptidoglycan transglycosylase